MEVYKRETEELIRRFVTGRLTFPECMRELDAALAALVLVSGPKLSGERLDVLCDLLAANNQTVMAEVERRISLDRTTHPFSYIRTRGKSA
ncbi:MAG: hypothetical protein WBW33_23135 [Bryobacteraceae bacterium]